MHQDDIRALFDRQAASYDQQWAKTAPIRDCLHLLVDSLFAQLPANARILCVGAGTGAELAHLARKNSHWQFTVVEPANRMLEICQQRAQAAGFASRCHFHEGYLESLSMTAPHDAATCFLVSQFILDQQARARLFRDIGERLVPAGLLASSDLASDSTLPQYEVLLHAWMHMMASADISPETIERMRTAYANDVGVLAPHRVAAIIESAGFEPPVQFFQAGLICGWLSRRARTDAEQYHC